MKNRDNIFWAFQLVGFPKHLYQAWTTWAEFGAGRSYPVPEWIPGSRGAAEQFLALGKSLPFLKPVSGEELWFGLALHLEPQHHICHIGQFGSFEN